MTMADAPKIMADRHRDEIQAIIDACEASVAPHKEISHWSERSGGPKPAGHNPTTVGQATKAIAASRAKCSKDIADACERHRAEANAPAPAPTEIVLPSAHEDDPAPSDAR